MKLAKFIIWLISFVLAMLAVALIFPETNSAAGGAGTMIYMIFGTVLFRALIASVLNHRRKKKEKQESEATRR